MGKEGGGGLLGALRRVGVDAKGQLLCDMRHVCCVFGHGARPHKHTRHSRLFNFGMTGRGRRAYCNVSVSLVRPSVCSVDTVRPQKPDE